MDILLEQIISLKELFIRNEDLILSLSFPCPLLGLVWFTVFLSQDMVSTDTLPSLRETFPASKPHLLRLFGHL